MSGFGLGIRYLNGWAMAAADGAKKEIAEWPPHPDRVFMALAAAWFETGQDAAEGAALRWLELLSPPALVASDYSERHASGGSRPTTSYVPVNDTTRGRKLPIESDFAKLKEAGLAMLPEHRVRQDRRFPVAIPERDTVHLIWDTPIPNEHRETLTALARKVTHVGHSASFTQVWLDETPPVPNWQPTLGIAEQRLRVFGRGRLDDLEARANFSRVIAHAELRALIDTTKNGKAKVALETELKERFGEQTPVSLRPEPGLWSGYTRIISRETTSYAQSHFQQNLVVLSLTGRRLSLPATLKLCEALRGAVIKACPEPVPEWVCGHAPDGRASDKPHLALLPLSFVDADHADGRLMGVALAIPRDVDQAEAARCLDQLLHGDTGIGHQIKLYQGEWLECRAQLEMRETPPLNLRPETWTAASKLWASTTPVALDRHFEGKAKWEQAAETVKDACRRIGLPRPREVLLHPVSRVRGAPHARDFPYLKRKSDGGRIHHAHAVLLFDEPVCGPVLIGAGRYRGYGFCRPLKEVTHQHE